MEAGLMEIVQSLNILNRSWTYIDLLIHIRGESPGWGKCPDTVLKGGVGMDEEIIEQKRGRVVARRSVYALKY